MGAALTAALRRLSQEAGATLFMTLLAAFQTVLYRYSGQADLGLGAGIANRNRAEIEGLIGFFVNTLVLRSDLSGAPPFSTLLKRVRERGLPNLWVPDERDFYPVSELPLLGSGKLDLQRLKDLAPLMEAALRWLAEQTPGSAELLRLLDGTPVGCGQSTITAKRSGLFGYAGYGYEPAHSRYYWGVKLLLVVTADGTVTGFGLANPKLFGEREQTRQILTSQPANRPAAGTAVVTDKGLAGKDSEQVFTNLDLLLIRPARRDEKTPRPFPNWLRQRIEAIIWTLKRQLGLEDHGGRVPLGLWTRVVQRLLALNAVIWHNWNIGAPVKRSLIAYDH